MSSLALDLQATLDHLDPEAASKLELKVRDALESARSGAATLQPEAVDKNGWPVGFFDETAGSFANEPFDFPTDLPLEPIATW